MARRVTAYDDALRSTFGRVTNVTAEQAREAAERHEQAGDKFDRAAALREYAADLDDEPDELPHVIDDGNDDEPDKDAPSKRPRAARKPKRRSTSKLGRATRQAAVGEPVDATASAIRSGGSAFWTVALGTVVLILLYNLVANGDRAAKLIESIGNGAARVAYPKTAFPERYTVAGGAKVAPPRTNRRPSRPGRTVPITNTTRSTA